MGRPISLPGALGALLWLNTALSAADRVFVVAKDVALVNHWPGPDGFLGTADDVVKSQSSRFVQSSPNANGSYGYLATSLFGLTDNWLPGKNDTATYLDGTLTLEDSLVPPADIPKLKALQFSGTELFPGHGPYKVKLSNPRNGVYSRAGQEFTFSASFDFDGTFVAGPARSTNGLANGHAYLIESADFATDITQADSDSMKAWINQVVLPLARRTQPNAILCGVVNTSTPGSVPGTAGSFPPLVAFGTFIAFENKAAVAPTLSITSTKFLLGGLLIEWNVIAGRTYRVDSSTSVNGPYLPQAHVGSDTKFLDLSISDSKQKYYRIIAE